MNNEKEKQLASVVGVFPSAPPPPPRRHFNRHKA